MTDTWREVAEALADRMVYQADRCPSGHDLIEGGDIVTPADPEAVHADPARHALDCPFCADTVAYRRYLAKARRSR